MCRTVDRYLDGPCDSASHQLKQLLANDDPSDSEHIAAVTQLWCEIFDNEETWLTASVCVTCFAILWLALKGEDVFSMVGRSGWLVSTTKMGADFAEQCKSLLTDISNGSWCAIPRAGNMVGMSPLKPRCREDSYRSFGMSQKVPCRYWGTS